MATLSNNNLHYFVKRPDRLRRSFAIYSQQLCETGRTKNVTIYDKDIEAVNNKIHSKTITLDEANRQIETIRARLAGVVPTISNSANENILEEFFKEYLKKHPFLVDKESAKHKYKRAVKALGKHSLLTVSYDTALKCLLLQPTNNKQREVAHKLNGIFKYLNRDIELPAPPQEIEPVIYITEQELNKLVAGILSDAEALSGDLKAQAIYQANAYKVFFYAGPRHGEFRGLNKRSISADNKSLHIATQLDTNDKFRLPKNRKIRKAYIHPKGVDAFYHCVYSNITLSHQHMNDAFQRACAKHLNRYDLSVHCLRHSYAVFLLSLGVPKALLAQSMGNSEKVIDMHYAGFILSDLGMDTISRIVTE